MINKVKDSLLSLMSAIQAGKLYAAEHPKFLELVDDAYLSLKETLSIRKDLVIGIVDNELVWEDQVFFDLSRKLRSLIQYLEERGIERFYFYPGLTKDELIGFISYLLDPESKVSADPEKYFPLHGINNIRAGKLKALSPGKRKEKKGPLNLAAQHKTTLNTISLFTESILKEKDIDYLDLKFNMLNFMETFMGRHQEILNLLAVKRKDLLTFVHLLNVAILAMHISSKMGYSREDVLDIGIAALFHDIGKISISQKTLKKPGNLTDGEYLQIQSHALEGAKKLLRYTSTLGLLPAVVAFEHHLRYDLKGYPKVPFTIQPHKASLLVSLCDVYDALALIRSYKKDYPPFKIYTVMLKEKGKLFDPELLKEFFKIMGVWSVGTLVILNDGRVAVVREADASDIFRPKIEVIFPENKKDVIFLKDANKKIKIVDSLNPHSDGKKYLSLV